ncbi:MAG: DUF2934 domain-containing protein [Candidatus Omnitrophica bacterium]|nr:DUF2934 domain-containing protein [Candidatus Omnitrophota bacterium]
MIKKLARKLTGRSKEKKETAVKKTATEKVKSTKAKTQKTATKKKAKVEDLFELIEKKAYELWGQQGYVHGNDENNWHEAERTVKESLKK